MNEILKVLNPENNSVVDTAELKNESDLEKAVDTAYASLGKWKALSIYDRAEILYRFADLLDTKYKDGLAKLNTMELGKPILQSLEECHDAAEITKQTVERGKHLYGKVLTDSTPGIFGDLIYTKREPLGVIACVIPFNYPLELTAHKIAPALLMGNTVIVKAPTSNPLAVLKMGEILQEAGIPEGVAQFIICDRNASTEKIIKNPKVAAICMTGSTLAGIEIARNSVDTLKTLMFELGGNDGLIIFDDVDLDKACGEIVAGRMINNGQICCSSKRLIVHNSIREKLAARLAERLAKLNVGSALDPEAQITSLVSESAAVTVEKYINHTIRQGATCFYGGKREGARIYPTILTDVSRDMDIAKDLEVFGPVLPIIGFDTEEEAIEIINSSSYGLSSGILTKDLERAFRIAPLIEAGATVINGTGHYRHYDQPFGGFKYSGIGREGISAGLEECSQEKTYILKSPY